MIRYQQRKCPWNSFSGGESVIWNDIEVAEKKQWQQFKSQKVTGVMPPAAAHCSLHKSKFESFCIFAVLQLRELFYFIFLKKPTNTIYTFMYNDDLNAHGCNVFSFLVYRLRGTETELTY